MTADVLAAVILASIVLYVLLGGADFGGGLWDLLASGPRATAQRRLIERAIAPIWEANHVWLIIAVVLLFTGFPAVFAAASIALHIPLSLLLLGIVLRGSAFTFRHYGDRAAAPGWGRVFAVTSIITPLFLGISLGALSSGEIRVIDGRVTSDIFSPWIGLFPTGVGLFTLALFALLAAVYLTCETEDPALQDDFRRRALWAGIGAGGAALIAALSAAQEAAHFKNALLHSCALAAIGVLWPLSVCSGALSVCSGALSVRSGALSVCSGALSVRSGALSVCPGRLSVCSGSVSAYSDSGLVPLRGPWMCRSAPRSAPWRRRPHPQTVHLHATGPFFSGPTFRSPPWR